MNKKINIVPFIMCFLLIAACDSPNAFDCFKKSGEHIVRIEPLINGRYFYVEDDLNVEIEYGSQKEIKIMGGSNLVESVSIEEIGDSIFFRNENKCKWVREYGTLTIRITTDDLLEIESRGYGWVKSINTLEFQDFIAESKDGSGDFDLEVKNSRVYVISNYISNMTFSGETDFLKVEHAYNDGKFLGKDLSCKRAAISHLGVNDVEVNVETTLTVRILSNGNVKYLGSPDIELEKVGSGKLLNVN